MVKKDSDAKLICIECNGKITSISQLSYLGSKCKKCWATVCALSNGELVEARQNITCTILEEKENQLQKLIRSY